MFDAPMPVARQLAAVYRPTGNLVFAFQWLAVASAVAIALTIASMLLDTALPGLDIVRPLLVATTGIAFCVWMYRTNRNAHALGASLGYGPHGWAWLFCPFANLWKPYQALRELFEVSATPSARPVALQLWWACWVAFHLKAFVYRHLPASTRPLLYITTYAVMIAGALAAVAAVQSIHRAQERRASAAVS